jgi:isoquinoline 1-oxidoreductase beta subunit
MSARKLSEPRIAKLSRRNFLRAGAATAGGLFVGFAMPVKGAATSNKLNAYVHVGTDDSVTLFIHKAEMGQGTVTSLSQLLAEELECDWNKIRTEFAPVSREYGGMQGVFGSSSVRSSYDSLRRAGAVAREMLVQAAGQQWNVAPTACRAENHSVVNAASGARLAYGALAEAASKLQVPANPTLKDPSQYRFVGKRIARIDTPSKVDGSASFGIDVRLPGLLYANVARCPVFGGKVKSFDAAKTKAVAGVKQVVQISTGVAVVADNTWAAMQGKRVLEIEWDEGAVAKWSTPDITQSFLDKMSQPGTATRKDGDVDAALAGAAKKIESVYQVPYLAHAPMEPLNCTADVHADHCSVWASTQGQSAAQQIAMRVTGLPAEKVEVHTHYMGGGFGRRAAADYIGEAVEVSKSVGAPVKLTWSREDDMQQDFYRPASYTRFTGAVDAEGWPSVFASRVACPQFGGNRSAVEGISDVHYTIPNVLVDCHNVNPGIPVSYWRSVGYSQNTFFAESFLDELAHVGGKDPLEVRRRLLARSPRARAVVELAAEKAGWGKSLPAGHGLGISLSTNIGSFTAQVAEVSVTNGRLKVHHVVCAVDCGKVVNPAIVEQQIQGGIAFGLTAMLKGGITIERGRVRQANFNTYDMLRIDEMPQVEVHIVASTANPGGIGEASTPGIAPAVGNAIFAATGKRVRTLPIRKEDLA